MQKRGLPARLRETQEILRISCAGSFLCSPSSPFCLFITGRHEDPIDQAPPNPSSSSTATTVLLYQAPPPSSTKHSRCRPCQVSSASFASTKRCCCRRILPPRAATWRNTLFTGEFPRQARRPPLPMSSAAIFVRLHQAPLLLTGSNRQEPPSPSLHAAAYALPSASISAIFRRTAPRTTMTYKFTKHQSWLNVASAQPGRGRPGTLRASPMGDA